MATPSRKPSLGHSRPAQAEIVDPRWLLRALGIAIAAAAVLGYLSVCLLVYQGGWQLMLHPSAKIDATPSIPFQPIRFDAAATGTPRLSGWWIPSEAAPLAAPARTILFLHDGAGSLSASVPRLDLLHRANVNILAFDYRGFGQSDPPHPTEARMAEDAAAALDFLEDTRHIPAAEIVPYGEGLGAVLAAKLAKEHNDLRAVIVDAPDPDAFARATRIGKARLLPMGTLVQEHFDLSAALDHAKTPKLLLADGPFGFEAARVKTNEQFFRTVPNPKMTVTFGDPRSADAYIQSITRFLDEYVPQ
jgi:pimeloyl-ACP methyl ester carboxylesterase